MTSLARIIAEGTSGGTYSLPGALHAITVDEDGMLIYTKAPFSGAGSETLDVNFNQDSDTNFFSLFENEINDYDSQTGQPLNTTRYDQWYYGSKDVFYYIDDDGYFCVRTNKSYTYTEPK